MINILVPMAGRSTFFDETVYQFPKVLVELNGKPMIEWVINNLSSLSRDKRFIFAVGEKDCSKYYLDNTLKLLAGKSEVIRLKTETKGAACSCLMAVEQIDNDLPLIIANCDQILDVNLDQVLSDFESRQLDAGVICFDSVHPKWSYSQIDEEGWVVETAEKRPISRNAIAGFYYFRRGADFVSAAFRAIRKDSSIEGAYYIAPILNELILDGRKVGAVAIPNERYHSFYSPQKIEEFERMTKSSRYGSVG